MSQSQPSPDHHSPDPPTPYPDRPEPLTNDQLAAQARAAADQALQLAKLAEESARLARHLNEQVLARSGQILPVPSHDSSSSVLPSPPTSSVPAADGVPIITVANPPWIPSTRRRRHRRSSRLDQFRRQDVLQSADVPQQITIRTAAVEPERSPHPITDLIRNWRSLFLSTSVHVMILVVLGMLTFVIPPARPIDTILASFVEPDRTPEPAIPIAPPMELPNDEVEQQAVELPPPNEPPAADEPAPLPEPELKELAAPEPAPKPLRQEAMAAPAPQAGPNAMPGAEDAAIDLAQVGSRSEAGKALLLKKYGGTAASEAAVGRALDWFVRIQRQDGSWNFNDVGQSSHAGTVNNPMGATSYVLLAFLGSGQTHLQGEYKRSIGQGLRFLLQNARAVPAGADFRGPNVEENHNFYVQGAAAMALCEAYAMTKDRKLRNPAQGAVNFIVAAQDPQHGGWRYAPRETGCTSVTTLQLTALKSAQRCGFTIPPRTLDGIRHFYTTVKCDADPTGRYSYRAEGLSYKGSSTAQAALGRMYLGVPREDEDLQAAVALLDDRGPYENRYHCYYATQVLKNWGGPEWERWNESLREELIRTQDTGDGPGQGSWAPLQRGPTDISGGRLFTTALSTLTLEVYYRYLPIYDLNDGNNAANEKAEMSADDAATSKTSP